MKKLGLLLTLCALFLVPHKAHAQSSLERCQAGACFGFGPPTGNAQLGYIYQDVSQSPPALYCAKGNAWVACGGGGSGSGTVNPATQFRLGYYPNFGSSPTIAGDTATTDGAGNLSVSGLTAVNPVVAPSALFGSPSADAKAALPSGAKGYACDEASTAGVPAAGVDYLRCDSSTHTIRASFNGGSEFSLGTGGGSATWPPSASGPTFSPSAGAIASGTTVTTSCGGGSPFISTGSTAVAGGTGIAVSSARTLFGACQGSGYFTTGSAAYTITAGYSFPNSQSVHGSATPQSSSALPAFSSALTAGSLIVVHQYSATATFAVPTDTAGNTYVDCGPGLVPFNGSNVSQCFYALNTHTTASNVVTIRTTGATTTFFSGIAFEVLGAASSSPIDGGSGVGYSIRANATGGAAGLNTLTATSLTPAGSGDLIVAFFASAFGSTAGTSPNAFTLVNGSWIQASEYFTQATSAAITATASDVTSSDNYAAIVIAVRP